MSSSSSTVAALPMCYCSISKSVDHRGHGSALDTLSRTGRQFVDGYFNVIGSKRLCDDGLGEGTLGVCWAMTKVTAVTKGRSTVRGDRHGGPRHSIHRQFPHTVGPRLLPGVDASMTTTALDLPSRRYLPRRCRLEGSVGAGLESQILLHH